MNGAETLFDPDTLSAATDAASDAGEAATAGPAAADTAASTAIAASADVAASASAATATAPADDTLFGSGRGAVRIFHGDNLAVTPGFADGSFTLVYLDPPFNTGRSRRRPAAASDGAPSRAAREQQAADSARIAEPLDAPLLSRGDGASAAGAADGEVQSGFRGRGYARERGEVPVYQDSFDDYGMFMRPRLLEAWRLLADDGTLYVHLDYREVHHVKVLMDELFGRDRFLNELIWAYDYGAKSRRRWPTKHETILVYVKDPKKYWFDSDAVDREPYMAPGLVTPEKAARGKLPTDVWWHTIVPTSGPERTGYPTQKPEGVIRRIIQASTRPGDRILDPFAGSGTTGAVASALGREAVLIDDNEAAIAVMRRRMPHAVVA